MSEVFADSFYFLALLNRHDAHHSTAVAAVKSLHSRLVTTHWVLVEVADGLCIPVARQRSAKFLVDAPSDKNLSIISDFMWFERGLELYRNRPDKSWSLTDCISFAVMEARGVREALTGDHHFEQAGFVPLLARA
jgi:uncharacterized protein